MIVLSVLRTTLFIVIFYSVTALAVLAALVVSLFGRRALRRFASGWLGFHAWCVRWILGIRTRIEGNVPAGPRCGASAWRGWASTPGACAGSWASAPASRDGFRTVQCWSRPSIRASTIR